MIKFIKYSLLFILAAPLVVFSVQMWVAIIAMLLAILQQHGYI